MSILFYRPSDILNPDYVNSDDEQALIENVPYFDTVCDIINESLEAMISDKLFKINIFVAHKDDVERNKHLGLIEKVLIEDGWSCDRHIVNDSIILSVKNPFYERVEEDME